MIGFTKRGSETGKFKFHILLAGPSQVGKTTTEEFLRAHWRNEFELGLKYKYRAGGPRPSDGTRRDSQILHSLDEVQAMRDSGNVAVEYGGEFDTIYLANRADALRTDKHMTYISVTHEGASRFMDFFARVGRGIMPVLLYTNAGVLEDRIRESDMTQRQMRARLSTLRRDFAEFHQNADQYMVLLETGSPFIHEIMGYTPEAEELKQAEIAKESARLYNIIRIVRQFYTNPNMSNADVHRAYLDSLAMRLAGRQLRELSVALDDGEQVKVDLSEELDKYLGLGNILSREAQQAIKEVYIVKSFASDGRQSLLVKGSRSYIDDVILQLIVNKIKQEPTGLKRIDGQDFTLQSKYGYFKNYEEAPGVEGFALYKDGARFSLGDQLAKVNSHPSLHIGFMYSSFDPGTIRLVGFSVGDINKYALSRIELHPNGSAALNGHSGTLVPTTAASLYA